MKIMVVCGIGFLLFAGCTTLALEGEFASGRQALLKGDSNTAQVSFERVALGDPNHVSRAGPLQESIWTYLGRAQYHAGKLAEAKESLEKALSRSNEDQMARLYLGLTSLRQQTAPKTTNSLTLQDVSYALREGIEPRRVAALARERGIDFDVTSESESQLRKGGADEPLLNEIKKIRAETVQRRKTGENQLGRATKEITAALTALRDSLNETIAHSTQGLFWDTSGEIRSQIQNTLPLLSAREPDLQKIVSAGEWIGRKLEEEIDLARRDEREDLRRRSR